MPSEPKAVVIIPARWASTRFPGKPLAKIMDKPMIQWVVEQALKAENISRVIVATDDSRIYETVKNFGGEVVMTSAHHVSGSDRIAEVAESLNCDIVVNVQGDEPLIPPKNIDLVVRCLLENPEIPVGTLKTRITNVEDIWNPNIVKVVTSENGKALYFSRLPIPFHRDKWGNQSISQSISQGLDEDIILYQHIGLYGFNRKFLLQFTQMEPSTIEKQENLEQLRILDNGFKIQVMETEEYSIGVDQVEDIIKIERVFGLEPS